MAKSSRYTTIKTTPEFERIKETVKKMAGKQHVAIGFLENKDEDRSQDDFTNAYLGSIHEFGVEEKNIPERSFLRSTYDRQQRVLTDLMDRLSVDIFDGHRDIRQALGLLGQKYKAMVQSTIREGEFAPWAESTRKRRERATRRLGFTFTAYTPLIDTGEMLNAINYEVRDS